MNRTLGYLLLIASAAVAAWYFLLRKGAKYAAVVTDGTDPYASLRANIGAWDSNADDSGIWVVIGQDFFPEERTPANHPDYNKTVFAALAFLKGANLYPDSWAVRSVLKDDIEDFIATVGYARPIEVRVGEFVS